MPILGIDPDKCICCGDCVDECPHFLFSHQEDGSIGFADPESICMTCGHCIAICPEDAIHHEAIGEVAEIPGIETPGAIVSYEQILSLLRVKRSIRRYKPNSVPDEILDKVITALRYAPSGANVRNWRYKLISDQGTIKELAEAIFQEKKNWERGAIKKAKGIEPIFYDAPHILIMSSNQDEIGGNHAGIAFTYGMLAAETLGLGSCWIGYAQDAMENNRQIKKLAGVRGKVWGVMTLGYPAVTYHRAVPRPPLRVKGLK